MAVGHGPFSHERGELSRVAAFVGRGLEMVKCLRPGMYVSEHKSVFTLEVI